MSRARDNIHSNRSREDIDRDQEAQQKAADLRLTLLYTADPAKYHAAMEEMFRLGMDVKVGERTRAGMLDSYTRRTLDLVQPTPGVTINQGVTLDAATIMTLVRDGGSGVPNSGSLVPSEIQPSLPTPTPHLMGTGENPPSDHWLRQPVVHQQDGGTDGPPERASSAPAPDGPPAAPRSREADETAGDPARCPACHARTDDEPHACPVTLDFGEDA
jgi:hypothetical protein